MPTSSSDDRAVEALRRVQDGTAWVYNEADAERHAQELIDEHRLTGETAMDVCESIKRAEIGAGPGTWKAEAETNMDNNRVQEHIREMHEADLALGDKPRPMPIAVLLSGSGTNLQALIDRIADGSLNAEIKLVVSSRPSAYGLKRAQAAGIPTLTLSKEIYADPIVADEVIASELWRAGVSYVVMAGYMRMVHEPLLAAFPDRVVNLHPALLPSFTGAHAIRDAFDRGVKVTGVTVHFANAAYDQGPIIAQRALPVEEDWDVDTLEEHIHQIEHELYPEVIQMLADGRVHVNEDHTVSIAPTTQTAAAASQQ